MVKFPFEEMTDQEIINRLALFIGWKKIDRLGKLFWYPSDPTYKAPDNHDGYDVFPSVYLWNQLTSWDDWRVVEEKIMEDEFIYDKYANTIAEGSYDLSDAKRGIRHSMCLGLPTLCKTLVSILPNE